MQRAFKLSGRVLSQTDILVLSHLIYFGILLFLLLYCHDFHCDIEKTAAC